MSNKARKFDHKVAEVNIRGLKYEIYLHPKAIFKKLHPDCYACIEESERKIHFSEEHQELSTIRHEIFHAYIKACFYDYVPSPTAEGLEELACETFSHFAEEMTNMSYEIHLRLTKAVKERELKKGRK